jgi:hypothetical protein
MLGSTWDQSKAEAFASRAISPAFRSRARLSAKRPPLKRSTFRGPQKPPVFMASQRLSRPLGKVPGWSFQAPSRAFWNSFSGSRPTSSAKKVNTTRMRKRDTTSAGKRASRLRASPPRAAATSRVTAVRARAGSRLWGSSHRARKNACVSGARRSSIVKLRRAP